MSATDFLLNRVTVLVLYTGLVWSGQESKPCVLCFHLISREFLLFLNARKRIIGV